MTTNWRLKTTEMYSLSLMKVRSPKSAVLHWTQGVSRATFLLEALRIISSPLSACGIPSLVGASLQSQGQYLQFALCSVFTAPSPPCVSVRGPSASLIRTLWLYFRAHWDNLGKSLHLKKDLNLTYKNPYIVFVFTSHYYFLNIR